MKTIKMLFAGDFCPRNNAEEYILNNNIDTVIKELKEVTKNVDIAMLNLETPLSESGNPIEKTGPNLRCHPKTISYIKAAGFNTAGLANNHIADYGGEAVMETISLLEENGINHTGAGKNIEDAKKPLRFMEKDMKISILAFAENEFTIAGKEKPGASPVDPFDNLEQIRKESKENDMVIVYVHGGNEHIPFPNQRIKELYREYIKAGASAVIGMHPHCPQGMEMYLGCPIIYSLGNLLFPRGGYSPQKQWWRGYLALLKFNGGKTTGVDIIPYTFGPDQITVRLLKKHEKKSFMQYFDFISDLIKNDIETEKLWNAWCVKRALKLNRLSELKYPVADANDRTALVYARNLFSCEAHYDLYKNCFNLLLDGVPDYIDEYEEKYKKLQAGGIYKL